MIFKEPKRKKETKLRLYGNEEKKTDVKYIQKVYLAGFGNQKHMIEERMDFRIDCLCGNSNIDRDLGNEEKAE